MIAKALKLTLTFAILLFIGCSVQETNTEENLQVNESESFTIESSQRGEPMHIVIVEYYVGQNIPMGEGFMNFVAEVSQDYTVYFWAESATCQGIYYMYVNTVEYEGFYEVQIPQSGNGTTPRIKKPSPDEVPPNVPNGMYAECL